VAYQIDVGHSGQVTLSQNVQFPGASAWSVNLGGSVSYPLIAGGRVFVTTAGLSSGYGTQLYALDAASGETAWGPVPIPGTYFWSGSAFEGGRVFVVNFDGVLRSFDASSGQAGWSVRLPNQYAFSSPPTAVNGIVYTGGAGSGGTVYAVDETNGDVLWTAHVENGDDSSPAISNDGMFVSYACRQVYKFALLSGQLLWHDAGPCEGGGGKTPVYKNGRLYVRDPITSNSVYDAATGAVVGEFNAGPAPAIGDTNGYFLSNGTLRGVELNSEKVLWGFAGDGDLVSAPTIVNQYVIVGSGSGTVYALDGSTGDQVWSANAGSSIAGPDEQNVSQPLTGFAAGEGMLVVPAGERLTAWKITAPCRMVR
jgi:outer membrane protein assembly factor BamB